MDFGVYMFPTDFSIGPAEFARAVEERELESLLFPEHTHIPASRESPFPAGGELPPEYSHSLDPFVALTAAAAVTTRVKIGTGICLVIERDPIVMAKEVASLDLVSGGRLLFGVGGGWNREEMANHGTDFSKRWGVMRERIEAMKAIWSQEEASYHGRYVNFERIWSWPKPVQKPHPPILVGGHGERTFQRIVRYGDEWMPIGRGDADFAADMRALNVLAAEAGRAPIAVTVFGVPNRPQSLERHRAAGVKRCLFPVVSGDREAVLPRLDRVADVIGDFMRAGG